MTNKWPRHVVSLSHIDPDLHQWLKDEAARRSDHKRVYTWQVVDEALRLYKAKCETQEVAHDQR